MKDSQFNTLLQVLAQQGGSIESLRNEMAEANAKIDQVNAKMDRGFIEVNTKMNQGFIEVHAKMNQGFIEVNERMKQGFIDQAAISNGIINHFEKQPSNAPRAPKRRSLHSTS